MSSDVKTIAPIIFGCSGAELSAEEKSFYRDASPAGFILFQKNCETPEQTKKLVDDLRAAVDWNVPVLIDQEGGRVQRLKPPVWPKFQAPRVFGEMYLMDKTGALAAVADNHRALAAVQCPLGINVNCVPVLDVVPADNKVRAIDDRAFGSDPHMTAALGISAINASIEAGMTPVMKHMPGHGRAVVDSHHELPRVMDTRATLEQTDFLPFKMAAGAIDNNRFWGMTAHVIYDALDPAMPATLSAIVIEGAIRTSIGFKGLLLTDDLFMDALAPFGDVPERARRAIQAGCDIALHCHGTIEERARAVEAVDPMREDSRERLTKWLDII